MESTLNDKTIFNTYADIIDWDILTEREYQIIRDLKDNGIEINSYYYHQRPLRSSYRSRGICRRWFCIYW